MVEPPPPEPQRPKVLKEKAKSPIRASAKAPFGHQLCGGRLRVDLPAGVEGGTRDDARPLRQAQRHPSMTDMPGERPVSTVATVTDLPLLLGRD
jgi:hypothetical protein